MPTYDVFNGDADGICALIQLRLAEPAETTLITGYWVDSVGLGGVRESSVVRLFGRWRGLVGTGAKYKCAILHQKYEY
ncbi:hypothetical protein SAMN05216429_101155 [Marinobacter persicus]|uniref:Uncharacterized protein n=1 Tax=Marinobacter persicus TaxID=930118 RepID=A0A1I3PDG5_9GAMM|nr:hypothetical protein GCM10008110_28010 [Marinobacter persicus]SFJ19387.1 hypothetical protein SAMN05216429_101155 [Marinobacter persicus]